jgi:hypothetical protein
MDLWLCLLLLLFRVFLRKLNWRTRNSSRRDNRGLTVILGILWQLRRSENYRLAMLEGPWGPVNWDRRLGRDISRDRRAKRNNEGNS